MGSRSMLAQVGSARLGSRPGWQALAAVAFVLMEMSWMILWVRSLSSSIQAVPRWQSLLAGSLIVLGALGLAHLSKALRLRLNVRRLLLLALLLFSLWMAYAAMMVPGGEAGLSALRDRPLGTFGDLFELIPARLWLTLAVILLWWRGIWLARLRFGPMSVLGNFRTGVVMFLLFAAAGSVVPLVRQEQPMAFIFTFLYGGMVALIAGRVDTLRHGRGGGRVPFNRQWLWTTTLVTLVVLGLVYAAAALVSGQADFVRSTLYTMLLLAGALVASPLLLALALLTPGMEALREALPTPVPTAYVPPLERGLQAAPADMIFIEQTRQLPPGLTTALVVMGVLVFVGLLVWGLRRALEGLEREDPDGERETLLERAELAALLRRQLASSFDALAERMGGRASRREERLPPAERVRQVFAALMELAGEIGAPYKSYETPREFSRRLAALLPIEREDLELITHAYQRVRYGQLPESVQEVEAIENAWGRVQAQTRPGG